MNVKAFYQLSYGVYLCTAWEDGRPVGCVANSAMQITAEPATIAVSINRVNNTHKCIEDTGYFALCVLGEHCEPSLIGRFGFMSSKTVDKFAGVNYRVRGKMPVPDESIAWFACKVIDRMETETHTVFLGEVVDADELKKDAPMTYAYYHKVLKGKTSANAPTYVEESAADEPKTKYVCDICSYEYDGATPFEELPDDWVCPLCGMGKEHFQRVEAVPAPAAAPKEEAKKKYVCDICSYEYEGEVPFEELPEDWVCPLCGMGKEHFVQK